MVWETSDNDKIDECIQRLDLEERKLNQRLEDIKIIKTGAIKIRTIKITKTVPINEWQDKDKIILQAPLDISGDPMSDEYRLEHLEKIIKKTISILGPIKKLDTK